MRTLTPKEWNHLYKSTWRRPYAHLTKEERGSLVRACRARAVFDSCKEAHDMMRLLQPHGRLNLCAYTCCLCQGIHIGSRRHLALCRRLSGSDDSSQLESARLLRRPLQISE